ncbi:MAG: response regulator transcription factor, partial [Clostridiales bacterium]|nr:response regulator transcription factor [Clostridiales bacterium]
MSKKIFIVDDDKNITSLISLYLKKEKYTVYEFNDSDIVYENFKKIMPDLLIVDIMMPNIDGLDLLKKIKRISDVSVIMLSAKGEIFDKVLALELGADDYIVKPFEPNELLARIKAVLRRSGNKDKEENLIMLSNLTINL